MVNGGMVSDREGIRVAYLLESPALNHPKRAQSLHVKRR